MSEFLDLPEKSIQVKDSIVAFIDILGFSELIEEVRTDENELNKRLNHFYRAVNLSFDYLRDTAEFTQKHSFPEKCHEKFLQTISHFLGN